MKPCKLVCAVVTTLAAGCTSELPGEQSLLATCDPDSGPCTEVSEIAVQIRYFPLENGQAVPIDESRDPLLELGVDGAVTQVYSENQGNCAWHGVALDLYPGQPHAFALHPVGPERWEFLDTISATDTWVDYVDWPIREAVLTLPDMSLFPPNGAASPLLTLVIYGERDAIAAGDWDALKADMIASERAADYHPAWLPYTIACEP